MQKYKTHSLKFLKSAEPMLLFSLDRTKKQMLEIFLVLIIFILGYTVGMKDLYLTLLSLLSLGIFISVYYFIFYSFNKLKENPYCQFYFDHLVNKTRSEQITTLKLMVEQLDDNNDRVISEFFLKELMTHGGTT